MLLLCLGAQNLQERHQLKIGPLRSVPLPAGFLVGMSVVLGVLSGGSAAAVLIPAPQESNLEP
jgi:hypothetical protein